jgi:hypothetical protein
MKHSDSIKNLAEALAKAQAEMPVVQMNATNPFLKNKFADLGAVISASRPVLAKYNLALAQFPTSDGDRIGITSILAHSSGEWVEDTVMLLLSEEKGKSDAQVAGSIITYLRRYAWSAILGLHADEDTDGNKAQQKQEKPKEQNPQPTNSIAWTVAQKNALIIPGLAKNDFAAKGMLGLSNLPQDAPEKIITAWGQAYRKVRGELPAAEAAEYANDLHRRGEL